MYRKIVVFLLLLVGLVACSPGATSEVDSVSPERTVLVIGDISNAPTEKVMFWQPLADYLSEQLADDGVSRVEIGIAPDLGTMIQWMQDGKVDLYFDSPYPALVISEESGAQPILRRFKGGVSEYHSVFFVAKDSEYTSLSDLQGQMVALEENYSTSGFMLPVAYMLEQKMQPALKEVLQEPVTGSEIGFTFSGDDDTTIEWVLNGEVPAGVVDSSTFMEIAAEDQQKLRIIAETEDVPRQMAVVRPELAPDLVAAIRRELLIMDESEEGMAVLEMIETTQFDEFQEGVDVAMTRMREMYKLLQSQ
jgi:phosphonate transport system substrate-binding protein